MQEKEKQISCLENRIQTFVASPLSIEYIEALFDRGGEDNTQETNLDLEKIENLVYS